MVLLSVWIVVLANAGWMTAEYAGAKDAKAQAVALPSIQ